MDAEGNSAGAEHGEDGAGSPLVGDGVQALHIAGSRACGAGHKHAVQYQH